MAEERIDIQIVDKVDANIAKKLTAIGGAAERAENYLERLKSALNGVNGTPLERLAAAMAKMDAAQAKLLNSQARLTNAQNQGALSAQKIALAQQKVVTETQRSAEAQARAAGATSNAAAAQARATVAQQRATAAASASAAASQRSAAASATAGSAASGAANAMQTYSSAALRAAAASGQVANSVDVMANGLQSASAASQLYLRAGRQTTAVNANILAQFQDIGVSLAGGQNPLLVLVQQGSQLSYIASTVEGGYKAIAKSVLSWFVVQKTANTESTKAASANLLQAETARVAAAAEATKTQAQANVVIAQQAATAATLEVSAAKAQQIAVDTELAAANSRLAAAQLFAARATVTNATAQQALTAAMAEQSVAAQASVIAANRVAAARLAQAEATSAIAAAELAAARSTATVYTGLTGLGFAIAGVIAVLAPLGVAFAVLNKQANDEAGLKQYVTTLGLTAKETKKLEDVTVTTGDTLRAAWQVTYESLLSAAGLTTAEIATFWKDLGDKIVYYLKAAVVGSAAALITFVKTVAAVAQNIGILFNNAGVYAKNAFLISIQELVNGTIVGLNKIGDVVNSFSEAAGLGKAVESFGAVDLGVKNLVSGAQELVAIDIGGWFSDASVRATQTLDAFGKKIRERSIDLAKARLAEQARNLIEDRSGSTPKEKVDRTTENRARAIAQINLQLDNELSRMRLLKEERLVQQRLDRIEEQLANKKIKLNEAERAAIEGKVRAIEAYKFVQAESDRIVEEADGPLRLLNASNQAAVELYKQGAISAERYSAELIKATQVYKESTDPLYRFNEAILAQSNTLSQYGVELEKANYLEALRQEYQARGLSLYDQSTGKLREEVAAIIAKNDALRQQQFVQSELGGVLNPILQQSREVETQASVYAELNRLRQNDLVSEEQYQQARAALYVKYNEARLSATSDFFGALASATKGGYGAIGAISKAAAVAQATIDGYLAVQKALASAPPPLNFVAAAAVGIKTAVQVAGIVSTNAGSFANGGQFMVAGKSGVDANNINMNVTRGERVTVETKAQQRANDKAGGAAPVVNATTKVINMFDEREFIQAMNSVEGEQVVLNIIRRNPRDISEALGR